MAITAPPFVSIAVRCATGNWAEGEAKRRADNLTRNVARKGYDHVKSRRFLISGRPWYVVQYLSNEKGKFWFSRMFIYTQQGNSLARVRFAATTSACRGISGILPSGSVHSAIVDGVSYRARFGDVKTLLKEGVVCSSRKHDENRQLFKEMRGTLR